MNVHAVKQQEETQISRSSAPDVRPAVYESCGAIVHLSVVGVEQEYFGRLLVPNLRRRGTYEIRGNGSGRQ